MIMLNATNNLLLQTLVYLVNTNVEQPSQIPQKVVQPEVNNSTTERCYGKYGCFKMTYPWTDTSLRPVSEFPEPPEKVNPKFCLYTRNNRRVCQPLDITNTNLLYRSYLNPVQRVYFIGHGFLESGNKEWIKEMTEELLILSSSNVIVVDWSGGSEPPYTQAVANIRLVGTMTAHLINLLVSEVGVRPELIHIIGHSLGAHLAAYAGQIVQQEFGFRVGRISGLDPAEPHFSSTDPIVRLDPTDADFVDVVHTDAGLFIGGGLGIYQPVGHVDFYPNGGIGQPGCSDGVISYDNFSLITDGIRKWIGCNHIRSYKYFIESINPGPCSYIGIECSSWEGFQNGSCFDCKDGHCPFQTKFGMHSDIYLREKPEYGSLLKPPPREHIKMYFMTSSHAPFCRHHYRVTWKISGSCKSLQHRGEVAMITLILHGEKGTSHPIKLKDLMYYEPNSLHRIVVPGEPVGRIHNITLNMEYKTSMLNPLTWRLTVPRLYLSWIQVESFEDRHSVMSCPETEASLFAGKEVKLTTTPAEKCNVTSQPQKTSDCDKVSNVEKNVALRKRAKSMENLSHTT